MGLLDDAIREHLDLKRRRGADPAEVERAEREALGPVRRNPNPADLPAAEEEPAAEAGFAYDHAEEEGWSHDSLQEPVPGGAETAFDEPARPEAVYEEPAFEQSPPSEPAASEPAPSGPAYEEEPEPFPTASPSSRPLTDLGGGETQEYNVEDYLAAEEESAPPGDEDVLEETPDFLQDTPDHDRLWFEQRPPKDFDFDE